MVNLDAVQDRLRSMSGSKAGQLDGLWTDIEAKLKAGVKMPAIVEILNEAGFEITLNTFRTYLARHRKKVAKLAESERPQPAPGLRPQTLNPTPRALENGNSQEAREIQSSSPLRDEPRDSFQNLSDVLDPKKAGEEASKYTAPRRRLSGVKK